MPKALGRLVGNVMGILAYSFESRRRMSELINSNFAEHSRNTPYQVTHKTCKKFLVGVLVQKNRLNSEVARCREQAEAGLRIKIAKQFKIANQRAR